jgi:hypothetical protein
LFPGTVRNEAKTVNKETLQLTIFVVIFMGAIFALTGYLAARQESEIHNTPLAKQRADRPTRLKKRGPSPQLVTR